jgi:hypothetical protein
MSVCRSTSKRQTSKTEADGFTARTEGLGNMHGVCNNYQFMTGTKRISEMYHQLWHPSERNLLPLRFDCAGYHDVDIFELMTNNMNLP